MPDKAPSYSINGLEKIINSIVGFIFYYRLVVVIGIIAITVYSSIKVYNYSSANEQLKNLSIIVACGSILIGIFYSIINYEHNQIKFNHELKSSRNSFSFTTASEWFKPTMVENLKITKKMYIEHKHLINDNKATDFSQLLDSDESARSALVSIFNYLECVSLAIDNGILDDDFMKSYLGGICTAYLMDYGFYIEYKRNTTKSPLIWINFTKMAERWQSLKK
jgi:hypothetical protein